jgi:hypothetical protein
MGVGRDTERRDIPPPTDGREVLGSEGRVVGTEGTLGTEGIEGRVVGIEGTVGRVVGIEGTVGRVVGMEGRAFPGREGRVVGTEGVEGSVGRVVGNEPTPTPGPGLSAGEEGPEMMPGFVAGSVVGPLGLEGSTLPGVGLRCDTLRARRRGEKGGGQVYQVVQQPLSPCSVACRSSTVLVMGG